jgi:small subunit ribosomal protein S7
MPRKGPVTRRDVLPDPVYNSKLVTRLINRIMIDGKRGVAQSILYNAFNLIQERTSKDPMEVFEQAIKNIMPVLEVKARRVGGANYQVPIEVRPERRSTLGLRWLVNYSRLLVRRRWKKDLLKKLLMQATTLVLPLRSAKIHTRWQKPTKRLRTIVGRIKKFKFLMYRKEIS